jgi:hypothetical protein
MEKLVVYLVCKHINFGSDGPLAVFSTRKSAEKFRKKICLSKDIEIHYPIIEMELDKDE